MTHYIDEWASFLRSHGAAQTPGQQGASKWLDDNSFDEDYWRRMEEHPDYNPTVDRRELETHPGVTGYQGDDQFRHAPWIQNEHDRELEQEDSPGTGGYTHHFEVAPMYRDDLPVHISIGHSGWENRDRLGDRPAYRYQVRHNGRVVHQGDDLWGPVGGPVDHRDMARSLSSFMSYDADRHSDDPDLEDEENRDLRTHTPGYRNFLEENGERLSMASMEPDPEHPDYEPLRQVQEHEIPGHQQRTSAVITEEGHPYKGWDEDDYGYFNPEDGDYQYKSESHKDRWMRQYGRGDSSREIGSAPSLRGDERFEDETPFLSAPQGYVPGSEYGRGSDEIIENREPTYRSQPSRSRGSGGGGGGTRVRRDDPAAIGTTRARSMNWSDLFHEAMTGNDGQGKTFERANVSSVLNPFRGSTGRLYGIHGAQWDRDHSDPSGKVTQAIYHYRTPIAWKFQPHDGSEAKWRIPGTDFGSRGWFPTGRVRNLMLGGMHGLDYDYLRDPVVSYGLHSAMEDLGLQRDSRDAYTGVDIHGNRHVVEPSRTGQTSTHSIYPSGSGTPFFSRRLDTEDAARLYHDMDQLDPGSDVQAFLARRFPRAGGGGRPGSWPAELRQRRGPGTNPLRPRTVLPGQETLPGMETLSYSISDWSNGVRE